MKKLVLLLITLMVPLTIVSQQTITLTFTAIDSASYVQLDSIKVMNRSQGGDTVLYWNDTVLVLNAPVGLPENNIRDDGFELRSYPNPVTEDATIELVLPESGETALTVSDILGRSLYYQERYLHAGSHTFDFVPGCTRMYLITATFNGYRESIKIVNSNPNKASQCTISYKGYDDINAPPKVTESRSDFKFEPGDELLFIGYVNMLESGILDTPDSNETYTLQFAYNIPCPGIPTIEYEGQVYNTVQIFSQCWLKENLNAGSMISGDSNMTNNGILEKYCYNDLENNCFNFGALYLWEEMMQYNLHDQQGICPPGWHVPNDEEWKVLEGAVDHWYGIGDDNWEKAFCYRGFSAGDNLKTVNGWYGYGNDQYGFSAKPGGNRSSNNIFQASDSAGFFWTSTKTLSYPGGDWSRCLYFEYQGVARFTQDGAALSVRCIKNRVPDPENIKLTFTAIDSNAFMPLDSIRIMNISIGSDTVLYYPDTNIHLLNQGDQLLLIGYVDTLESGIPDTPLSDSLYSFQFAYNIPCPGMPTISYGGQIYNTVQIFSQCWLKENLNYGMMIPGDQNMTDNGMLEKYCYNNEPDSCAKYGALYQWDEMMNYSTIPGFKGICPFGWHIPTDDEWKVLEGSVDSQYGIGDTIWNQKYFRGYDAGANLKATSGWFNNHNGTDLYGFTGLPGGRRWFSNLFADIGYYSGWWTSSENIGTLPEAWERAVYSHQTGVERRHYLRIDGISVRCIKD